MKPVIVTHQRLQQAAQLRHLCCTADRQSWGPSIEPDPYDAEALHLGIEQQGRLIACMRAIRGDRSCGYLLDSHLRDCLGHPEYAQLERRQGIELSGRAVHPELDQEQAMAAVEMLFKMFCQYALRDGIKAVYLVQAPSETLMLRRFLGLNFKPLQAAPHQLPSGKCLEVVGASTIDLLKGLIEHQRWPHYEAFMCRFIRLFDTIQVACDQRPCLQPTWPALTDSNRAWAR